MKAVFLDKGDGLVEHHPLNAEPRRIRLAGGAGIALRLLASLDYRLFVVSNQSGIAHGCFGEDAMPPIADRLADLLFREHLSLEGFYYCPPPSARLHRGPCQTLPLPQTLPRPAAARGARARDRPARVLDDRRRPA